MFFKKFYKEIILSIIIILILGIYGIMWYFFIYDKEEDLYYLENNITENNIRTEENNSNIKKYVEIKGAIQKPGVYSIIDGNIIKDVIDMAGGLKDDAYTLNINLSKKVEDEMVIYIYNNYEYQQNKPKEIEYIIKEIDKECNCPSYDISSCVEEKNSIISYKEGTIENSSDSSVTEKESGLININTASKEELMSLDGIGEAKAQKIIDYRNANGNFKTPQDITNISGISNTIYENIKDHITV